MHATRMERERDWQEKVLLSFEEQSEVGSSIETKLDRIADAIDTTNSILDRMADVLAADPPGNPDWARTFLSE